MNRNYNGYLTNGTSALKADRRMSNRSGVRVVCTPGAKHDRKASADYVSEHTVGYREHACDSLNFIYDSIEQGSARGSSASFFSTSQVAFVSAISVALSIFAVVL